jgi:alkanesulfonate monooxygenase SsuD/methylene tetrahydromethanopterin reductase-like flavin-dependent oxidoreductase (luciferase family)
VLSAADPARVFQQFATLDLLSNGRAEIVAGRGSFIEAFPLFGLELDDYDSLLAEKLDLLLNIRESTHVHWSGQHRAPLTGQGVYPRPLQNPLPVWLWVGGTPSSFIRAGTLGLPLMVAIIEAEPHRFRPLIAATKTSRRYRHGLREGLLRARSAWPLLQGRGTLGKAKDDRLENGVGHRAWESDDARPFCSPQNKLLG